MSVLLEAAVQPLVEITAQEAPMFSDFRRRQFTGSGKLIDGGFWNPEKPRHLRDGQNLVVGYRHLMGMKSRGSWCGITHGQAVIGIPVRNLTGC